MDNATPSAATDNTEVDIVGEAFQAPSNLSFLAAVVTKDEPTNFGEGKGEAGASRA